jgi:hypothetical protein
MVTGRDGFFSDERLHTIQKVRMPAPGVPLFEAVNHCCHDRYRITKTIATDPYRDVLIQRVRFDPIAQREILKLWVFLVPAVENEAYGNDASIDPAGQCLIARRAISPSPSRHHVVFRDVVVFIRGPMTCGAA